MSTKINMTPELASEKIISLLREVKREGIENLINFIKESNYMTNAACYSHHNGQHGLMLREADAALSRESLIIVALCHDLGKARLNGKKVGDGFHPYRALYILKMNGVQLSKFEEEAIGLHHSRNAKYSANPLLRLLRHGDGRSARINQKGVKYSFCVL